MLHSRNLTYNSIFTNRYMQLQTKETEVIAPWKNHQVHLLLVKLHRHHLFYENTRRQLPGS